MLLRLFKRSQIASGAFGILNLNLIVNESLWKVVLNAGVLQSNVSQSFAIDVKGETPQASGGPFV